MNRSRKPGWNALVPVGPAVGAGAATASPAAAFAGGSVNAVGVGRGKNGKFLFELRRAALRAFSAFPVAGTHEDFAVASAFFAMKLVNWHGKRIAEAAKISSPKPWGQRLRVRWRVVRESRIED